MKNLFTLLFLFLVYTGHTQNAVVVTEGSGTLAGATNNTISVFVKGGDEKDVSKSWKKYLKDLKGKISDKKELFADDCRMKEMGDNTFDLYSKTEVTDGVGVKLIVGVDLGGAYLNSVNHPEQFKVIRDFLYAFGVEQNKAAIGVEIVVLEKALDKLNKDLKSLEKDDKGLDSDIADYKEKIKKAQADKVENQKSRTAKAAAITAQKQVVEQAKTRQSMVK